MTSTSIYSDLPAVHVSFDGNVAIVKLDRPAARNSFNQEMCDSLIEAARRLDQDDRCKVVVVTSDSPSSCFCAGADLSAGDFSSNSSTAKQYNTARNPVDHRDGGGQVSLAFLRVQKPVIAAINGHAIGIGITMTLSCDIRLAWKGKWTVAGESSDAKIGFVFGSRAIVPEAASSFFLPRLIGHSKALELFMTAKVIPASSKSLDLLFSSLHDTPEATLAAGIKMAHEIAQTSSALSLAMMKALVWRGRNTPEEQHLLDSQAMHVAGNTDDSKEGVRAFKEKRTPQFPATLPKDIHTISTIYPWWTQADIRKRTGGAL